MQLTKKQLKTLEQWDQHFTTAIHSKYASYPGASAVHTIHKIYCEATNTRRQLNASCSSCIFRLLVDMGNIYFKDKQEFEQQMQEVKPKRTRKKS